MCVRSTCLRKLVLVCAAFACIAAQVSAQYRFDSWTTDNGLPAGSVNSILQTRDGYLWLATFGGLVRFDGLRFQVFNTGNTKGLRSGRFMFLYEDHAGALWITTEEQGLTRYKDGKFVTFTTAEGLASNQTGKPYEDPAGNLRVDTAAGLAQLVDERFSVAERTVEEPMWQRRTSLSGWYADSGFIHRFQDGQVTSDLNTGYYVNGAFEDREGRLWLSTREERLLRYESGNLKIFSEAESYRRFPHVQFLEDRQGSIWLGTGDEGLLEFKNGAFTRHTTADGLTSNGISALYQDREGTVWVATPAGLSRVSRRAIDAYSMKDGLAAEQVYPIYENRQGEILIGSWDGLTRYDHGVFTNVSKQFGVTGIKVTSLLEDRSGGLWIGTWGWGLKYVKDGKVLDINPNGIPQLVTRAMIQDQAGNIWFGCNNGLIQSKDGKFTLYSTNDGLGGNEISSLYEDRQGQIWIGTDNGISRFVGGRFTSYRQLEAPASIVRSFHEDAGGVLWIGTYDGGLYRLQNGLSHVSQLPKACLTTGCSASSRTTRRTSGLVATSVSIVSVKPS